jgi:predicted small metal-binding protein
MVAIEKIDASLIGIGSIIKSSRFVIPIYQRPYSWTDAQIEDLYRDLADAIAPPIQDYFLGTIVTTRSEDSRLTIIDGQQRLVTVSVLIASIRDYFMLDGQSDRAQDIEREYLFKRDIRTQELTPHILLTAEDRDFFVQTVAMAPPMPPAARSAVPTSPAQQRLQRASEIAAKFIQGLTATTQKGDDRLLDLIEFLTEKAKLVSVSVGSESSAFVIFEVLNDRGLDLSITDLLKNFIFRTAGDRVEEAQAAWSQMTALITEADSEPELKTFIRHHWVARHGMTRERELYDAIKKNVKSKALAVEFAKSLAKSAPVYAGLGNPLSDLWDDHDAVVRQSIEVLDQLGVTQLRPLLMAIFAHFTPDQTAKALPMIVAWTVRFLICGAGGSGTLETAYALRAGEVSSAKIKTAKALWEAMTTIVPDDVTFKAKFATATVSKADLAKYYLRVLEQQSKSHDDETIVNPDQGKVNLEHILPRNPGKGWAHVSAEQQHTLVKRIGNLTLLATRLNVKAANAEFSEKKKHFEKSAINMTKMLCEFSEWSPAEIDARQDKLADLAVKAWPRKPL